MNRVFRHPLQKIEEKYIQIDILNKNIKNSIDKKIQINKSRLSEVITKLDSLSPLKTMIRGYSIVQKEDKVIKSVKDLAKDDVISIRLIDGSKSAKICD